ncbi:MAG: DUF4340 domain-containing protein [Armatimonadetes bacterium]|nr:DUF4340 domain-containing protein [Armatimonadota bacterium]
MNLWKTLGLLVAFGLLLAYVLMFERGEKPDHEADRQVVELLGLRDVDDVDEVVVTGASGSFTLTKETPAPAPGEKAKPTWKISAPIQAKADSTAIESYIKTLLTAKAQNSYGADQAKDMPDTETGLGTPSGSVTLKDHRGKTATLNFGGPTQDANGYYARPKDGKGLLVFAKYYVDENVKNKKLGDLRDKTLLSFLTSDVTAVTLAYPKKTVALVKKGNDWFITGGPKELKADRTGVDSILTALSTTRVDEFVEQPAEADPKLTGLAAPRVRVTIGLGAKGENGLLIGMAKPGTPPPPSSPGAPPPPPQDKVYVQRKGDTEVLLCANSLYDSCLKEPADLRDKTVLAFKSEDVTRVAYSLNATQVVLEKGQPAKKAGAGEATPTWQLRQPSNLPADSKAVDKILSEMDLLRATEFIDTPGNLAQYGLTTPRGKIELAEAGKPLPAVLLGKATADGASIFVMQAGGDTVMKVRASFEHDLPLNPNRLRNLTVVSFDRTKVKKIKIQRKDGGLCVLEPQGEKWEVTQPSKQEADAARVSALLTSLEDLHADEYVSDGAFDKTYGFDKPDVTVTVTLSDGTEPVLYVARDPKGGLAVYLKRKGSDPVFKSDSGMILTDVDKKPEDFKPMEQPPMGMDGMPPGGMPPGDLPPPPE